MKFLSNVQLNATPQNEKDIVNKKYVDDALSNIDTSNTKVDNDTIVKDENDVISVVIDDTLSTESSKPIANKAITNEIESLKKQIDGLLFTGTLEEYQVAYDAGLITNGMIVNITDDITDV